MAVALNSSQVQQNFGAAMDRALRGDDVIIERYGTPRAAIVEYARYRKLVDAERERATAEATVEQAPATHSGRPAELNEAAAAYQVGRSQAPAGELATDRQEPVSPAGAAEAATAYRYVVRVPGICGGQPILRGTRVPVKAIAGYHKLGMSVDEILAGLPHLTPAQVYEALSYTYDHEDEIEREIQADQMQRLIERHGFPGRLLLGELEAVLKSLPPLGADEAASFASDLAATCAQLPREETADPWAS